MELAFLFLLAVSTFCQGAGWLTGSKTVLCESTFFFKQAASTSWQSAGSFTGFKIVPVTIRVA